MHPLFLLYILFFSNQLLASEIVWEKNISVQKIEAKKINTFVAAPLKIDLNNADKSQLLKLNGIGPKKADAIIEYRASHGPFRNFKDLEKIKGFNKKLLAKILDKNKETLEITTIGSNFL